MNRAVLWMFVFVSAAADGRVLDLGADCSVPAGFTPSASQPFQLDWCKPADGDDITRLLTQIANRWPSVFAVRAPSSNLSLVSDSMNWANLPVKEFSFLESSNESTLRLQHAASPVDKYRMWRFANVRRAVIGGPGLRITFIGNHPGLGTGDQTQAGLIEFTTNDGSSPELADFRANVNNAHSSGLHFFGGASGNDGEVTINRFMRVNVAGRFVNSGVQINSGVRDLWFDPDNLRVMDPYVRGQGWDGVAAGIRSDGIKTGCADEKRRQSRNMAGAGAQYVRKISGGVTFEYGTPNANIFVAKYIGDGPGSPYRVRIKDFGFSGPSELTGLPGGVMVKKSIDTTVMKHDPLPTYGRTAPDFRFLRFEQLPSDFGNGLHGDPIKSGCASDNLTDNNYPSGTPIVWRAEASRDGVAAQYVTAYVDVTIHGVSEWIGMGNSRSYFQPAGGGADVAPGPAEPDRSFGHVLRATSGTSVPGATPLLDSNTVTGPGSWYRVVIEPGRTDQGTLIYPNDNSIRDTSVHGTVEIGTDASRTLISNVNFTGSARRIISIGARSDLLVENICAPAGSTIEGSGVVTYQGNQISLPYKIAFATNCSLVKDTKPEPPTAVSIK